MGCWRNVWITNDAKEGEKHERVFRGFRALSWLSCSRIPADKQLYQRQIAAADWQIDALVYELYGLTEEEIGVVEGGMNA